MKKYFPSSSKGYKREYYRWNYAWHDLVGYRQGDRFWVMRDGQNKIIFIKTSPNCWEMDPSYDPGCERRVYRLKGTTLYSNGGGCWENVYNDDEVEDIILEDDYWWFR